MAWWAKCEDFLDERLFVYCKQWELADALVELVAKTKVLYKEAGLL